MDLIIHKCDDIAVSLVFIETWNFYQSFEAKLIGQIYIRPLLVLFLKLFAIIGNILFMRQWDFFLCSITSKTFDEWNTWTLFSTKYKSNGKTTTRKFFFYSTLSLWRHYYDDVKPFRCESHGGKLELRKAHSWASNSFVIERVQL